jgi:DNA polymerase IIIc chi subunit
MDDMTNINFYCLNYEIKDFLFSLLTKLIEAKNKILIYSDNEEKMRNLDKELWTFKKISFIPHLLNTDDNASFTPIVITNELNNINNANVLFLSKYLEDSNFINGFDKIVYFFTIKNAVSIKEAQDSWKKYEEQRYPLKFMIKEGDIGMEKNNFLLS